MTLDKIRKLILIIFSIGIMIVLIVIIGMNNIEKSKKFEIIDNIAEVAVNSTDSVIIYVGNGTCEECVIQSYQMKLFLANYGLEYYYINSDELSKSEKNKIFSKLGLDKDTTIPTIAIYRNGKLEASQSNLINTNNFYKLLREYDLIDGQDLKVNYLSLTKYVEKIESNSFVLGIGSLKNEESMIFEEIMWNLANEYNIDLNFIYASNLNTTEGKLFESKLKNISDYEILIPSLIYVSNGNIIDAQIGLSNETEYIEFLRKNGIIE